VCGGPTCGEIGDACGDDSECCGDSVCGGGLCQPPPPPCALDGAACERAVDCCSLVCTEGVCGEGAGCVPVGDVCRADSDCCDGGCSIAEGETTGVCTGSCSAEGEACTTTSDCCDGICGVDGTCQPPIVECIDLGGPCDPADDRCCRLMICSPFGDSAFCDWDI
jgi:hypothetical protein